MKYKSNLELGYYWKKAFVHDVQEKEVYLTCPQSLSLDILSLSCEESKLAYYARDALHYALVAEYREQGFWDFLLNDTYNLEALFQLDQVDIVTMVLLILEKINHYGFTFPMVCYDLSAARCSQSLLTEATKVFLSHADFVPYDFELSPLLVVADAEESPVSAAL